MQVPSDYPPSAALLAYSALSVVLLLSLAIAIFEAASAIRRKFACTSSASSCGSSSNTNCTSHASSSASCQPLSNSSTCRDTAVRTKKMSLPEFTWMRHLRRCARTGVNTNDNGHLRRVSHRISVVHANAAVGPVVSGPPRLAVTSCSDAESDVESSSSLGGSSFSYSDSQLESIQPSLAESNISETSTASWCSISQLKQMGAVRFSPHPARRISSPGSATPTRKFLNTNSPTMGTSPRRSYAGMTYYAALPLTPGVARLCGSLSDILETGLNECPASGNGEESSSILLPRAMDQQPNSTALEARLKRIRLIRHR
jgi:hypothetical protein